MDNQKLIFPQEIDVWYVLPAIRRELSNALINSGLSQKKVAKMLMVTEAAISQYKNEKRAKEIVFDDVVKEEINRSAQHVVKNPENVFNEIMRIDEYLKKSGTFCKIHRSKSYTPEGCESTCEKYFFKNEVNVKWLN